MARKTKVKKSGLQKFALYFAIGFSFFILPLLGVTALRTILLDSPPTFVGDSLTIERDNGKTVKYNVELAVTPAQHAQGLMYRQSMPQDGGMLFLFPKLQVAQFWMKNTYIPLDMLFVLGNGRIAKIAAQRRPEDTAITSSGVPVAAVIELNGGEASRQGIKAGDKVLHSAFNP